MKSKPIFSVIIPAYNRAQWIGKTLESVLNQTYPHFEVLVIDDASTDATPEVVRKYQKKDSRIVLHRNEVNKERAFCRNKGFELAQGDFAVLLDSDDLMLPTNLEDAWHYIQQHPDAVFFHNLLELRTPDGKRLYRYPAPPLRNPQKEIMKGNFLSGIGVFLAKSLYKAYRFDEERKLSGSEDRELWIRILARYKVGRIPKINNIVLQHSQRGTAKDSSETILWRVRYIRNKIVKDPLLYKVYQPYLSLFDAHGYLLAAITDNARGAYDKAFQWYKAALRCYPAILLETRFWKALAHSVLRN